MDKNDSRICPHNPPHIFLPGAIYMVTGGVLRKRRLLDTNEKKGHFLQTLLERASLLEWELEAWSVLPNHYHFIARAPDESTSLIDLIRAVHSISSKYLNRLDGISGRKVWYNYWDTCITYEKSYLARLHYVHINAVKHGLVKRPEDYPYCSYRWFNEYAEPDFCQLVFSQPIDQLRIEDDY